MSNVISKLRIYEDSFDQKSYTDVNRLANAYLTQADTLSPVVTHLYGRRSDRFPLMLSTEGKKRVQLIKSVDGAFKVPVMGKPKKSDVIVVTNSVANLGINKTVFELTFASRWFEKDYTIQSSNGTQAKIVENPEQTATGHWKYKCKLMGPSNTATCPAIDATVGARWGQMWASVGISGSRGNASRNQAPSMVQNQTSFIRKSYEYRGNVQNKVMVVQIPTKSGLKKYWHEWEAYDRKLQFMEECENVLWFSRYNRDSEGLIHDKDINSNENIYETSGLIEQIPNKSTYSTLTEEKIKRTMRDVFFNSNAFDKKKISIYVGTGSKEEFSEALKSALQGLGMQATSERFVSGSANSRNLVYGAYFDTYVHQDGHTATIKYLPLLDQGARADIADKHAITGLPITSYDMYFVDESTMEAENGTRPNIQYVAEEGRQEIEFFVPGMTMPKGYGSSMLRATDFDGSSIHFAKSLGIHMLNPVNSFKLSCDLV